MTAIGPCLGFYVGRANDVDSLVGMRDNIKPSKDLALFDEVYARASFDASLLVERLLAVGIDAAQAGDFVGKKAKTSNLQHRMDVWEAFTTLLLDGTPTEAFLNVAIFNADGIVTLVPGTGVKDAARIGDLRKLLVDGGMALGDPPPWLAAQGWTNMLPLATIRLSEDTQVEDLEAACRRAFEALEPHLRAAVEFAAGDGK